MKKLLDKIEQIEFVTGANFSYKLDKEFKLISSYLSDEAQFFLKSDFKRFFEKGKFLILNTFSGGILFLKTSHCAYMKPFFNNPIIPQNQKTPKPQNRYTLAP